jgi:hypothetical protein
MHVRIPDWTAEGWLPPLDVGNPTGTNRAPYPVSLYDLVVRFGTTPDRCGILDGYLRHRAALHANGYLAGFQWLDGSFMEDVETLQGRPPRDMDVVSFVHAPGVADPASGDQDALDHAAAKARFRVDSYFVELEAVPPREVAFWSAYWYSMWAHRRNLAWKGFLQVDLRPDDDAMARHWLAQNVVLGAHP